MFSWFKNVKKVFHELDFGDIVSINNNSTYYGLTGELGTITDIIQNKLFKVNINGSEYVFTKDALDYVM